MDKRIEVSILLDIYGVLLTEKQRDIMDLYFNDDLSLSEIAENANISRQAIYDLIKRGEKLLWDYESKLCLMKKNTVLQKKKKDVESSIELLLKKDLNDENKKILYHIKESVNDIN